ncbi:MAG: tetraacyldisaccharide 4'-kinase [Pyrinomonadaceae bacterium MAG19_C2-C3]|nr:tetraacyldisaccharide 4'-kinase [Pyrinomonadaceae bacterium MAG19_C2-C3]
MNKNKPPSLSTFDFRLSPFSLLASLYGVGVSVRAALYRRGTLPSHTLPAPVISVGNITTGGTGKTPLVRWLAENLAPHFKPHDFTAHADDINIAHRKTSIPLCILSRGYGRKPSSSGGKLERVIVSDGHHILADVAHGGDEPLLLAEQLLGIAAVISDTDRVAAARQAHTDFNSRLFILDDGFQHFRVRRDFDIVTIDATNPFNSGHLLPRGRLREPLSALRRADAIILTRTEQVADTSGIIAKLNLESDSCPIFIARTQTRRVLSLAGSSSQNDVRDLMRQPVASLCAIGNPGNFVNHLRGDGWQVFDTSAFPDHHRYTPDDITKIERHARGHGAQAVLTTAKDAVKLRGLPFTLPCLIVDVEFAIDEAERLIQMIEAKLNARQK